MKARKNLFYAVCVMLSVLFAGLQTEDVKAFGLGFAKEHSTMATAYTEDLSRGNFFFETTGETKGGVTHYYKINTLEDYANLYFFTHNSKALEVTVLDESGNTVKTVPITSVDLTDYINSATGQYDSEAVYQICQVGVVLEPSTTYYLKVDVDSNYRYMYAINQFEDSGNKDFSEAKVLNVSMTSQSDTSQMANDEFFYKFTSKTGNVFHYVNVVNSYKYEIQVMLYDENQQLVAQTTGSTNPMKLAARKLEQGKTYYVKIICVSKGTAFTVQAMSSNDDGGETMSEASTLKLKSNAEYRIQADGDVDWTKLQTSSSKKYKISYTPTGDVAVQLKDASGNTVGTITKSVTLSLGANKTYYFKVTGALNSSCKLYVEPVSATTAKKYVSVKKIVLKKTNLKLKKKKTYKLKIKKIKPSNASKQSVTYKSSKPKVVKVLNKKTGKIKALKKGKAVITCIYKAKDGSKAKAKCVVTVR